MLFFRYGAAYNEILKMDYMDAFELILYAYKQKSNDILMQRWISNYETQMSFDEFKKVLGINNYPVEAKKQNNNTEIVNILADLKNNFG